jgi:serine/threonine-protein kinase OSR1/STK39
MSESQPMPAPSVSPAPTLAAVQQTVPAEWPTDPNLYDLVGKIGQGAFATVWKARITTPATTQDANANANVKTTTTVCAVKVLNLDHVDTNLAEIRLEVQAMRLSSHPNVLTCHTAFCNDTNLWLVTPLMTKGSSLHSLQAARRALRNQYSSPDNNVAAATSAAATNTANTPATIQRSGMEQHILYILHETLLGLQYIHDNGQIHRDIKAGNILLDGNGDVRIADFGVSGWLVNAGSQKKKAKTFVGTPCWMAPEVMEQVHGYDYKADIWSLGITALELAKGYAPYAKYPPMKVLILTIQEDPPSLDSYNDDDDGDNDNDDVGAGDQVYGGPEEFSKAFSALVATCLQKNPAKRPTCQELLQSKYLQSMNDAANRAACKENIRTQVCNLVRDVGSQEANALQQQESSSNMPGNTPISIILQPENKDRPAGTTWVFADGSQVLSSSATAEASTLDDVMNEMDAFGMQTGGEHYDRLSSRSTDQLLAAGANTNTNSTPSRSESAATNTTEEADNRNVSEGGDEAADNRKADEEDDDDDLNDFMDEFELNTAGEDFRR